MPTCATFNRRSLPRHMVGITLTEIIIVLAIIALAATMAAPVLTGPMNRYRITSYTNEFIATLNLARSEAITRGRRVVVCRSSTTTNPQPECSNVPCNTSTCWEQGWIVFVDTDNNHVAANDASEPVLQVHGPLSGGVTLTSGEAGLQDYISYASDGRAREVNGNPQAGALSICGVGEADTRPKSAIELNMLGRARANKDVAGCP